MPTLLRGSAVFLEQRRTKSCTKNTRMLLPFHRSVIVNGTNRKSVAAFHHRTIPALNQVSFLKDGSDFTPPPPAALLAP